MPLTIKSKSGRKPLTIKPPPRKPLPDSAVAKAAGKQAATAKSGKGGPMTDAEKNSLLKNKKTRTVAEAASEVKADAKGYVFINGRRVRMISTKGQPPAKRVKSASNHQLSAAEADAAASAIRAIRTKLSRKELNEYRDLLLLKRRQLVGDLHAMEDQALRSGGGNLSHMPIHMADIGTDTFDQDFTLSLAENERQQLREIDQALQRIEDGTYGVCQMTGKVIPKTRLEAKPWAKYTVEAARIIEGQWGQ
ncbi:MAG TPA: TraR/DksA C4-type zinc finger protein [Phycisphaerales bacterium]|nr:TraR/DksA C4-type zinc finger protein [Phycisphaerales bacterium]